MKKAVYKAMDNNLIRRTNMERLHIFPGSEIPEDIKRNISGQIRPIMPVPKRLTEYSKEEVDNFPKIFDYPNDYVVRWLKISSFYCSLSELIKKKKNEETFVCFN